VEPHLVPEPDVQAHVHTGDHPLHPLGGGASEAKSARAMRDARARAIPHLHVVDQDERAGSTENGRPSLGGGILDDLVAASADSDWSTEAMTPVAAIKAVAPRKGEAGNWIIWTAMTLGGLARLILVSLGYLIAKGGETRIRAGVAAAVFLLAVAFGAAAGHQ